MQEMWVQSLGWEDLLGKELATHSSILAWEIPWQRSLVGYSPWDSIYLFISFLCFYMYKSIYISIYLCFIFKVNAILYLLSIRSVFLKKDLTLSLGVTVQHIQIGLSLFINVLYNILQNGFTMVSQTISSFPLFYYKQYCGEQPDHAFLSSRVALSHIGNGISGSNI